jgi:acetyl-CoA carboxylase biotin carboxyl carrier protein
MELAEIKELMAAFAASDLVEMHLTRGEWTLHLVRSAEGGVAIAPEARPRSRREPALRSTAMSRPVPAANGGVNAPLAGLAYLSPNPDAPDFVSVGSRVEVGDVVAVIEAMKVFNEIRAKRAGTVKAVLVASGDEVDAGQLLLTIE